LEFFVVTSQLHRRSVLRASGLVLPSLLEGFGLPVAETGGGVISLVTEGGTLHEVTGDSAVLVDPTDIDSIAYGMRALVEFGCDERKEDWRSYEIIFSGLHGRLLWPDAAHAYKVPSMLLVWF
jgi:glycosyltransferase involved in cell wall biosynthesis